VGCGRQYAAPVSREDFEIGDSSPDIRAAGGVLLATGKDGKTRVVVIHRPKYMDWSLPKGKLEKGVGWEEAALREVQEETGYRCEPIVELPHVSYLDRKGRRKLVRYWLMEPLEGGFEPHGEVDELRWATPEEADEVLTYPHDKELVHKALRRNRWRRMKRVLMPWSRQPHPI
jgi:8-oxo-dGTP diphosphatase